MSMSSFFSIARIVCLNLCIFSIERKMYMNKDSGLATVLTGGRELLFEQWSKATKRLRKTAFNRTRQNNVVCKQRLNLWWCSICCPMRPILTCGGQCRLENCKTASKDWVRVILSVECFDSFNLQRIHSVRFLLFTTHFYIKKTKQT